MVTSREKREKRKVRIASATRRAERGGRAGAGAGVLNVPDGVKFFHPPDKGEEFEADFVPYLIQEKGLNLNAVDDDGEPLGNGGASPEMTYYVHNQVGPDNDRVVCVQETFGKPCPVCRYAAKLRRDPELNWKDPTNPVAVQIKGLKPSCRQLSAVIPRTGEGKGKIHVWDTSYFLFGRHLYEGKLTQSRAKERGYADFANPETGLTLQISGVKGFKDNIEYSSIQFLKRDKPLAIDLDEVPCLEAIPRIMDYAALEKLFLQTSDGGYDPDDDDGDDEEEETPKAKTGKKKAPVVDEDEDEDEDDGEMEDEDEEDEDEDEDEDEEPVAKSKKPAPKKKPVVDEDDEEDEDEEPDEDEEDSDEEDEDEEEPVAKKRKPAPAKAGKNHKPKKVVGDDEDEYDEDEEEDDD